MSVSTVSTFLPMVGASLPAATPTAGLSDVESGLVSVLSRKLMVQTAYMGLRQGYYDGTQRLTDLGVSVPPQLRSVRTVVDWPRIVVDTQVFRCNVDGFRLAGASDVDDELAEHWSANDLDGESPLCWQDSMTLGRGFMIVGSADAPGGSPIVTVESPLNCAVQWDPRTRMATGAYQSYEAEGVFRAVLYLPDVTVSMSKDGSSPWAVDDRDEHGFGVVPVVRFPNRARSSDREGRSEITDAIMNATDTACRTLLGMETAREFYSVPHRYVLGASESDFVDASGNAKSALSAYMSVMTMFERDEEGNVPTVGQFTAYDPSVFTKIVDEQAQLIASYTNIPPSYFGLTTTANPSSADAIRVAENGLIQRCVQKQRQFSAPLRLVQQLVWRFAHGGADLPDDVRRLEVDWTDPATPTPAATTDALFKQSQMGAVPPTSDITLKRLGYSAAEREALAVDRAVDAGASVLAELATSLQAKEARTDLAVATDITGKQQIGPAGTAPVVPSAAPVRAPDAPA